MPEATVALINIGNLASGQLGAPLLDADAILIEEGLITTIGRSSDSAMQNAATVIDARGMDVMPGLIDAHMHPVLGDWSPRLGLLGYLDWGVRGGVTSMISAGEVHLPGRPIDRASVKALAVLAYNSFKSFRPRGLKVHAGALILEESLQESDFAELAAEGVWLVGEIGLGSLRDLDQAEVMTRWAQAVGMKVMMHAGGASVGASTTAADLRKVRPDIVSHINGGSTAMVDSDIDEIVHDSDFVMDAVLIGNPVVRTRVLRWMAENDQLHRMILGIDHPGGAGAFTLGMLRLLMEVVAIDGLPVGDAIALCTGNAAAFYGLNSGKIEIGKEADLVVLDASAGSPVDSGFDSLKRGDMPGIAAVIIDGELRVNRSNLSPPAKRRIEVRASS